MLDCASYSNETAAVRALCDALNVAETSRSTTTTDLNNFFLIWASSLVLFMHAGFAMLSAGALRAKNTKNILISTAMDICVCALAWYLLGFGFAFGQDAGGFIGSSFWVGIDVGSVPSGLGSMSFWMFQFCFAATAATIVAGAIAERARFDTYCMYSFIISLWVYPVVVHWVWGGGFLTLGGPRSLMGTGVVDFAGCGPVHMVGGLAGAIGSKIMRPRMGRFDPLTSQPIPIPGHSASLATLGMFILWVGWFGFNCGSVIILSPGNGQLAARAGVNTILSSAMAAISALYISSRNPEHLYQPANLVKNARSYDIGRALNGALAGLVSITGCCAYVEMWAAVCIGLIGGAVFLLGTYITTDVLMIDDPLDATAVHLFAGVWGIIAGAFFANPTLIQHAYPSAFPLGGPAGVFYGAAPSGALVANAVVEIVCVFVWVGVNITLLFSVLQFFEVLRIAPDEEMVGIDESHHGGGAYPHDGEMFSAAAYEKSVSKGKSTSTPIVDLEAAPVSVTTPLAAFAAGTPTAGVSAAAPKASEYINFQQKDEGDIEPMTAVSAQ